MPSRTPSRARSPVTRPSSASRTPRRTAGSSPRGPASSSGSRSSRRWRPGTGRTLCGPARNWSPRSWCANTGEVPVKGLGIAMSADGLEFAQRYDDCRYPEPQKGSSAVCELPDVTIEPGETVVVRPAFRFRVPGIRMYSSYGRDVWALDMGPGQYRRYSEGGGTGHGPPLEAEPTTDAEGAFVDGGGATPRRRHPRRLPGLRRRTEGRSRHPAHLPHQGSQQRSRRRRHHDRAGLRAAHRSHRW